MITAAATKSTSAQIRSVINRLELDELDPALRALRLAEDTSAAAFLDGKPFTSIVAKAAARVVEVQGCIAGLDRLAVFEKRDELNEQIAECKREIDAWNLELERTEGVPDASSLNSGYRGGPLGTNAAVRQKLAIAYLPTSPLAGAQKELESLRRARVDVFGEG